MMRFFYKIVPILLLGLPLAAQQTPAAPQKQSILISGARAHLGNGQVIENSVIGFAEGRLTLVGDAKVLRVDVNQYDRVIEASGMEAYPGFITPDSHIGLVEIEAVRATNDLVEVGQFNPSVRAIVAYNTDSDVTPTVRSNGVLLAEISPRGGVLSGQSSVVMLDAWHWEDAALASDVALHLDWPSPFSRSGWWAEPGSTNRNEDYDKEVQAIDAFFKEAEAYTRLAKPTEKNLKFEAMRGLFEGGKKLFIHVDFARSMMEAVLWAQAQGFDVVLVGASDAWRIAGFLKDKNVPVVLGAVHALPTHDDADIDQAFKTPALLHEAGVRFAFSLNEMWQERNLPFHAGHAVGYGLPYEAAVQALSADAARILGVDERVGSLEVGKDATFFLSAGDALDMRGNALRYAFIQGRMIDLDNKQSALARKFREKYARQ